VGVVGLSAIDADRLATLGYWIGEDEQGRGRVSGGWGR
jgi:RimJ/RimL family protein N-acetyltransferase